MHSVNRQGDSKVSCHFSNKTFNILTCLKYVHSSSWLKKIKQYISIWWICTSTYTYSTASTCFEWTGTILESRLRGAAAVISYLSWSGILAFTWYTFYFMKSQKSMTKSIYGKQRNRVVSKQERWTIAIRVFSILYVRDHQPFLL